MTVAEKLLPEFDEEMELTRRFLALVPDDRMLWKPHAKSMELGRLAWHVADFPEWTTTIVTKDHFEPGPDQGEQANWKNKTRAQLLARFDAALAKGRAALAAASDADMARHWKMEWGGRTIIDDPREEVYRKWAIRHMVHHRAQLGLYFRMLNIAIPGCYGPSADEMNPEPVAG